MNTKFNSDGYRRVTSKADAPTEPHYAVIEFDSVYIPGDQRSIDYPGHGYPSHSEDTQHYIVFENKEVWEFYVKMNRTKNIMAVYIIPATIKTNVTVDVNIKS